MLDGSQPRTFDILDYFYDPGGETERGKNRHNNAQIRLGVLLTYFRVTNKRSAFTLGHVGMMSRRVHLAAPSQQRAPSAC